MGGELQPLARRSDPFRMGCTRAALVLLGLLGAADPAGAASALRFPLPSAFGEFHGETLDPEGAPLGPSRIALVLRPDGRVVVEGRRGIDGREAVSFVAELEPVGEGELRLVSQRSRLFDASGAQIAETVIDHTSSQATCNVGGRQETIDLPAPDRVANVMVDLLLAPLARGELDEIDFQALFCSVGSRLLDVSVRRTGRIVHPSEGTQAVEIEYQVRLSPVLAALARPFLPRILFWIDPAESGPSLAQQTPLFPQGPTVVVVRRGVAPGPFLAD